MSRAMLRTLATRSASPWPWPAGALLGRQHNTITAPSSSSLVSELKKHVASNLSATPFPDRVPTRTELFSLYPVTTGAPVRLAWIEELSVDEESERVQSLPSSSDQSDQLWSEKEAEMASEGETSKASSDIFVSLHPEVWSVRPRIDTIQANVEWQAKYKTVSYKHAKTRYELPPSYTGRPWPQKGMGRARHSTIRSPLWHDGGSAKGPRSPRSYFYMLDYHMRVNGLIHTLSTKFAQDDVHFVNSLHIPSREPEYIEKLIEQRGYGMSTLIVDAWDEFPSNLTAATSSISHVNLMPVYGLNVHSMLKHKTLILTIDALNLLEAKLLFALHRTDKREINQSSLNPKIM